MGGLPMSANLTCCSADLSPTNSWQAALVTPDGQEDAADVSWTIVAAWYLWHTDAGHRL